MPINLSQNHLSLEPQEHTLALPVHAKHREQGTVSFTIRELPYAIKKSCELRFLSAAIALDKATETFTKISNGESLNTDAVQAVGQALADLRSAQLEVIRWGVTNHGDLDFIVNDEPIHFETDETTLAGQPFQVASRRMLRLYSLSSPSGLSDARSNLIALLSDAILRYQNGTVLSPSEVWQNDPTTLDA